MIPEEESKTAEKRETAGKRGRAIVNEGDDHYERGKEMKAITKSDIKRIRRAIKIADRANEYEIIEWAFGEIESVINKAEEVINKESKEAK